MRFKISAYVKKQLIVTFFICVFSFISIILALFFIPPLEFYANNKNEIETEVSLPVIMYHTILKNPENNKFKISEKLFEKDLEYLKENGFTTILVENLIKYTQNDENLPTRPVLLTFDDGALNNYSLAFPIAKKHKSKFVFSPIGSEADKYSKINDENPDYAHASWKRIKELSDSKIVEIQNHTYNMHNQSGSRIGCKKKYNETKDEYRQKFIDDISKMQNLIKENTGKTPTAFFYPFGACSKCSVDFLKEMGFKASFVCGSKVNKITRDPNCLFGLKRFLRPPGILSKDFFDKICLDT